MKNFHLKLSIFILIPIFFTACGGRKELGPMEYLEELRKCSQDLIFTFNHDDHKFLFEHRPSDIFLAEKLMSGSKSDEAKPENYRDLHYFILTINPNFTSTNDSTSVLKDYVFQALEADISLKVNNEVLKPIMYNVENPGFDDGSVRVLLAFESKDVSSKYTISLSENIFKAYEFKIDVPVNKLPILKI